MSYTGRYSGLGVGEPGGVSIPGVTLPTSVTLRPVTTVTAPVSSVSVGTKTGAATSAAPRLTSVSPSSARPGEIVKIVGRNLGNVAVTFGGFLASPISQGATQIAVAVPAQARGSLQLMVRDRTNRSLTAWLPFTVQAAPPPVTEPPRREEPEGEQPPEDYYRDEGLIVDGGYVPPTTEEPPSVRRKIPWLWIAGGVAVVGVGGYFLLRRRP